MIISHKHRYLFVEVPHTASHAIAQQLVSHYGGKAILRKHSNITQFLAQASVEERRYFKFATVRNPLDAATTDFEKLKTNHRGQFTNPAMLLESGGHVTKEHLREYNFVVENEADFNAFFKKFRNRLYNNWFLVGHRHFDVVMRFESLQEDFSRVLKCLQLTQVEPIPRVNKTAGKRTAYEEYYTPDIYHHVARRYGPFLKKWGYVFPDSWGDIRIPISSQIQFKVLDGLVGLAAKHVTLDPNNPHVYWAKKCADYLSSRF